MVMGFLSVSVTQCDEANKRFGRSDCCNSPTPNDCVNGGWPEFDSTVSPIKKPPTLLCPGLPYKVRFIASESRSPLPGTGTAEAAT